MSPYQATSTTRPSSPWTGMTIYETDTNKFLLYNGSSWVMLLNSSQPPGLQFISSTTFTTTATAQFAGVFSSSFTNYHCVLDLTASTATNFYIRLLVSTTAQTGNILSTNSYNQLSASTIAKNTRADQYGLMGAAFGTYSSQYLIDWQNPFATAYTSYYANGVGGRSNTDSDFNQTFARNIVTTSMDGFEITTAAAATLTGTMTIYGKR